MPRFCAAVLALFVLLLQATCISANGSSQASFLNSLNASNLFASSTTVPYLTSTGDGNPYGVATVPSNWPKNSLIGPGTVLVSNFNNASGLQGTGRTIVAASPAQLLSSSQSSLFFAVPNAMEAGLTTCLEALPGGVVVVGNAPLDSSAATPTVKNGNLLFVSANGQLLLAYSNAEFVRGPWDCTIDERCYDGNSSCVYLYVSNVLDGSVVRLTVKIAASGSVRVDNVHVIADGFGHTTNAAALVLGPTGLLLDQERENLLVCDTPNNRIVNVHLSSGLQSTLFAGPPLQGPLALVRSPFGTVLISNGDALNENVNNNMVVELSSRGQLITTMQLDTGAPGAVFGIAVGQLGGKAALFFAEDNTNSVDALQSSNSS